MLPQENRFLICRKDTAHHQQQRGSLPHEIQSGIREEETADRRKNRGWLPQEKRSFSCRKDRAHHQQQRGSLTPEIQSTIREKETAGRRKNRGLLPQKKRSMMSGKDRAHHQQQLNFNPLRYSQQLGKRKQLEGGRIEDCCLKRNGP